MAKKRAKKSTSQGNTLLWNICGAWRALGRCEAQAKSVVVALTKRGRFLVSRYGDATVQAGLSQDMQTLTLDAAVLDGETFKRGDELDAAAGPAVAGAPHDRETSEIQVRDGNTGGTEDDGG